MAARGISVSLSEQLINRPCNVRNKPGGRGPAEAPWRPTKRLGGKQHTTNILVDRPWTGAAKRWNGVWNHLWNQSWTGVWNGLGTNVLGSAVWPKSPSERRQEGVLLKKREV